MHTLNPRLPLEIRGEEEAAVEKEGRSTDCDWVFVLFSFEWGFGVN